MIPHPSHPPVLGVLLKVLSIRQVLQVLLHLNGTGVLVDPLQASHPQVQRPVGQFRAVTHTAVVTSATVAPSLMYREERLKWIRIMAMEERLYHLESKWGCFLVWFYKS